MRRSAGVVILIASVALGACWSGPHRMPEVRVDADGLEDIVYYPVGQVRIPDADLSAIGAGSGFFGELVRDSTVFAIRDLDPAQFVAMAIDGDAYQSYLADAQESEPDWRPPAIPPTHELFGTSFDPEALPEAACRYFDPTSDATPISCLAPLTLSIGGRTYRALGAWNGKELSEAWRFFRSDLEPLGEVAVLDQRLAGRGFDPAAYTIRGLASSDVIVIAAGDGLATRHAVFVEESGSVPTEVCEYVGSYPDSGLPCGAAVNDAMAAMERRVRTQEEAWYAHEAFEYHFTIEIRCDCPPDTLGPFTVTVYQSDLVEGAAAPGGASLEAGDPRLRWTPLRVNELFETVIRYAAAERHDVTYDEAYGFPKRLDADPSVADSGDEYGFTVTDFVIVKPE